MIDFITNLLSSSILYNIVLTILHSLWQGALLALLMNVYLRYNSNNSPTFRYNVAFSTLMLMGISVLSTFSYYALNLSWGEKTREGVLIAAHNSIVTDLPLLSQSLQFQSFDIKQIIPLVATVWLLGVIFFSIRLILGYAHLVQVRRSLQWEMPNWLIDKMEILKTELDISRNIRLAFSHEVFSPLMMGLIRPIIVFPLATINKLSPEEIELILRHEMGHIIRHDYAQNFMLRAMEVILFYHPCMWWTINIIEKERENHCDDYAAIATKDKLIYAKTLVKIKEMQAFERHKLALGFSSDKKSLLNRIKRILNHNQKMSIMKGNLIVGVVLLSSIICLSASTYYLKKIKTTFPEKIEVKNIKSFEIITPTFPMKLVSATVDTTDEEWERKRREKRAKIKIKSRDFKANLKKLKHELKELKREHRGSYNINIEGDWDDEDWEDFGEEMSDIGEKIATRFESVEFQEKVAEIAEVGSTIGLEIASSVVSALDHAFDKDLFHTDKDHFKFSIDRDFDHIGEGIGEMVTDIIESVRDGIQNMEDYDIDHDDIHIHSDRSEFSNVLLKELKKDGFFKKNKVSLELTKKGLKINGKTPSSNIREKYIELIEDYHDISTKSGDSIKFKYSNKNGNIKKSMSVDISN
ncbi:MAG: M56 family metallopeptidase [Saprospiraceae bacterium]